MNAKCGDAVGGFDVYRSAMCLDDRTGDCQTEPGALSVMMSLGACTMETFKDA
ncbi:hypothetical protein AZOA_26660 [Azoarcus sp. Aa7]|nr:hypothetical protein [Azoarcus sp. Aa7]